MTAISVRPYAMPSGADIPPGQVGWRAQPARAALLIHDMQRYFLDFYEPGSEPLSSLVSNVARIRATATELDIPVFYTAQPGAMSAADRGLLTDVWGPGMQATAEDQQIIDDLRPQRGDTALTKWRYSAFFRSDLLARLRALGRDQLLICGVYAHVGCLATAIEAFTNDIETFLIADAIADFGPDEHRMALAYAAKTCAAVPTTQTVLADLRESS